MKKTSVTFLLCMAVVFLFSAQASANSIRFLAEGELQTAKVVLLGVEEARTHDGIAYKNARLGLSGDEILVEIAPDCLFFIGNRKVSLAEFTSRFHEKNITIHFYDYGTLESFEESKDVFLIVEFRA